MTVQVEIDSINLKLLKALQENARISIRELGKQVNLCPPAVAERIQKLREAGVICGYRAEIDVTKIGLPIIAFTHLSVSRSISKEIGGRLHEFPEIAECYRINGDFSYILRVHVTSIQHLESFMDRIGKLGHSSTSIVLSTTFKREPLAYFDTVRADRSEIEDKVPRDRSGYVTPGQSI